MSDDQEEAAGQGAGAGEPVARTFEESWAEIRSLLEGDVDEATLAEVERHYLEMRALDPGRLADEVDAYLLGKLRELPVEYFEVRLRLYGFDGYDDWGLAQPLRDVAALDRNPWAKFTRAIDYTFDGGYMVDEYTDITEELERRWLARAVPAGLWAENPIFARVERLRLRLESLSENQGYSCKAPLRDFQRMLFAAKALKHLSLSQVWDMSVDGDFGAPFASPEAPALESLSLSDSWMHTPADVASIFRAERQRGLKSFTLGAANMDVDALIAALTGDDVVVELERLRVESGALSEAASGDALRDHERFAALRVLEIGEPAPKVLRALCAAGGERALETLALIEPSEWVIGDLRGMERVAFRELVIEIGSSPWPAGKREELEELASSMKFEVKFSKKKKS